MNLNYAISRIKQIKNNDDFRKIIIHTDGGQIKISKLNQRKDMGAEIDVLYDECNNIKIKRKKEEYVPIFSNQIKISRYFIDPEKICSITGY